MGGWYRCFLSLWYGSMHFLGKRKQWSWPLPCSVSHNHWTLTLCMSWWKSILSSYVMHSISLCCHRSEQRKSDSQTNKFAVYRLHPHSLSVTSSPKPQKPSTLHYGCFILSFTLHVLFSHTPLQHFHSSLDSFSLDSRPPHALTVQLFN